MKIVKVIILVVITLSALTAIACLGLLSAEDYMIREQAAYEELAEPQVNDGKPVKREGTYNFTVAGQRRYWRMQEMNNPKDGLCDYVDIYFD